MDSMKLYAILFATGCVLSMCMALEALDCNWRTQFVYRGRCETCPSGQFPILGFSKNDQSLCKECTGKGDHCFCNNTLCGDEKCSKCLSSPLCQWGEELSRIGLYEFTYICKSCPNQTYNDEEGKMCKPILDCRKHGLRVIFPGNSTHNARCGSSDIQNNGLVITNGLVTTNVLVVCLAITVLGCLAMFIYICIKRPNEQRRLKKLPISSSLKVPCDECTSCKLSKEEMGEA
ncbi:tumor necrosis factor receptor superfamily member 18 [Tachysurus fulvidraco]|uniref:tumor necrosis factor receptor superfamily member 18 n=1 Tax=Tachysurus fulvidraco TaxID=1234273 RepID=UPI001FEDB512|nr:tumor necrosis factor receptor superfamily member 18 [Tachysurus fulvidraco]